MMEISKKDLLQVTGISYGQLYRWKREGLIPENWFVKRPSSTGQETFFPKELILKRIRAIQKLKDHYSLEELANLLAPEVTNRIFSEEDLEQFQEVDIDVATEFMDQLEKDTFRFIEVLIMIIFSDWKKKGLLDTAQLTKLISHSAKNASQIENVEQELLLLKIGQDYYSLFVECTGTANQFQFDSRIEIADRVSLQELSSSIKVTYKDTFSFTFDEDIEE